LSEPVFLEVWSDQEERYVEEFRRMLTVARQKDCLVNVTCFDGGGQELLREFEIHPNHTDKELVRMAESLV
jgi:hypothetical protein